MHLHSIRFSNFRRLQDALITLESDISILVGSNNSGKTSAAHALQIFCGGSADGLSVHDFNASCWDVFQAIEASAAAPPPAFPTISLDLWFSIDADNLHRVLALLPRLNWTGSFVGLRIEFAPANAEDLLTRFRAAHANASTNARRDGEGRVQYHPWPKSLMDYLTDSLKDEYEFRYFVLDQAQFDGNFRPLNNAAPLQIIPDANKSGGHQILKSLLRVDCLHAQRHLSDSVSGARAEDLSKCLSRFYKRLNQRAPNYDALGALANSEAQLDEHLARVFAPTLERLSEVGYPGLGNPRLVIKSALNPAILLSSPDGARVHYGLDGAANGASDIFLPDKYNGLGFKNLIYMVVELLDLHAKWLEMEEGRPPLHVILIEEPEAHMHAQLQQAFIRKVLDILRVPGEDVSHYASQVVVTTHSPHILYERGFRPIRYFRRGSGAQANTSQVLNLSVYYANTAPEPRDFLERYMKLTHCDLFFADAAVLVEGNVERLLMPLMIEKHATRLRSVYLSALEIGGAFGHRFQSLIEFLGLTCLIVTDIDSVTAPPAVAGDGAAGPQAAEEEEEAGRGTACLVSEPGAITSNQTLIQWLPKKTTITDLLGATDAERTQLPSAASTAHARMCYQTKRSVTRGNETLSIAGRTFEEDFAIANLTWCQDIAQRSLGLRIPNGGALSLDQLLERLHKRIKGSNFDKTDFALGLLDAGPEGWAAPPYIVEGLLWLQQQVAPPEPIVQPAAVPTGGPAI